MPVSELFEAEVDLMELISYKPILSKGYQCILHIHTVADEATVKEILVAYEKNEKGDILEKQRPQFTRSFAKIICRIQTRIPIPLEKFEFMPQMGRFTLRDEGKTIAVGKVLKYKPAKDAGAATAAGAKKAEETKAGGAGQAKQPDLVFNMETGEVATRADFEKGAPKQLQGIAEEDEDEGAAGT